MFFPQGGAALTLGQEITQQPQYTLKGLHTAQPYPPEKACGQKHGDDAFTPLRWK